MKLKQKQMMFLGGLALVFSMQIEARADDKIKLAHYFGQKIDQVDLALKTMKSDVASEPFIFQDFQVNLAPLVSFGINSFLNITLSPEIDFILTQTAPVVDPAAHAGQPPDL